jgi:hypothetical protein
MMSFQAPIHIGFMPKRYCDTFMPPQKRTADTKSFCQKTVFNILRGHTGELSLIRGFLVF